MGTRFLRALIAIGVLGASLVGPGAAMGGPKAPRMLPDLRAIEPMEVSGPYTGPRFTLGDAPVSIDGCYPDERIRKGAQRCLRFDAIVGNTGDGAFELGYVVDNSEKFVSAYQRIFRADGSFVDRFATTSEFHPTHTHFHVSGFYVARLWTSTEEGGRLGVEPIANGDKSGFCPEDSKPLKAGEGAARRYSCYGSEERDDNSAQQVVGISAGWMDIYPYDLPDQFVEITGVPDGFYALEIEVDPNDVFLEVNENNNTVCVVVELKGIEASLVRTASC